VSGIASHVMVLSILFELERCWIYAYRLCYSSGWEEGKLVCLEILCEFSVLLSFWTEKSGV
jgi:hypothetical protein